MQIHSFLLISLFTLSATGPQMHREKATAVERPAAPKTILLEYVGDVSSSYGSFSVGAQLQVDTSIGFRYDVTFQNGTTVMSHVAIFYKFSSPHQTIYYNYLTHKSEVIKETAGDPQNNVSVVGSEKVGKFSCTHLQHAVEHGSEDYWMSKAVPGYAGFTQILKHIDPALLASVNETIFNWGGLVKLSMVSATPKGQATFTLNLVEAKTDLVFKPASFEVPKK